MININTSQNVFKYMLINPAYYQIIAVFWNNFSIFQKAFFLSHVQTQWRNTEYFLLLTLEMWAT